MNDNSLNQHEHETFVESGRALAQVFDILASDIRVLSPSIKEDGIYKNAIGKCGLFQNNIFSLSKISASKVGGMEKYHIALNNMGMAIGSLRGVLDKHRSAPDHHALEERLDELSAHKSRIDNIVSQEISKASPSTTIINGRKGPASARTAGFSSGLTPSSPAKIAPSKGGVKAPVLPFAPRTK